MKLGLMALNLFMSRVLDDDGDMSASFDIGPAQEFNLVSDSNFVQNF